MLIRFIRMLGQLLFQWHFPRCHPFEAVKASLVSLLAGFLIPQQQIFPALFPHSHHQLDFPWCLCPWAGMRSPAPVFQALRCAIPPFHHFPYVLPMNMIPFGRFFYSMLYRIRHHLFRKWASYVILFITESLFRDNWGSQPFSLGPLSFSLVLSLLFLNRRSDAKSVSGSAKFFLP